MGQQMKHPAGNFCWFELGTSDQAAAKEFYAEVMGWQYRDDPLPSEMGGVYMHLLKGDKEMGAMYQLGPMHAGVPPHWMPYVTVDDADATAAKVTELGGELVMGPFDVMDLGRMAMLKDPTGAMLSVWQPKQHHGADVIGETGTVCWNELATPDRPRASEFYTGLFGWSLKQSPDGFYTEIHNGGRGIGGMIAQDGPQWQGVPPHWLIYFAVDDCDATLEKVTARGGKVIRPAMDIPGAGRFAVIADPQGAVSAIIKPMPPTGG